MAIRDIWDESSDGMPAANVYKQLAEGVRRVEATLAGGVKCTASEDGGQPARKDPQHGNDWDRSASAHKDEGRMAVASGSCYQKGSDLAHGTGNTSAASWGNSSNANRGQRGSYLSARRGSLKRGRPTPRRNYGGRRGWYHYRYRH